METDFKTEFFKFQEVFESNYPVISDAYKNHYEWPEMDTLRHEACLCIAFGLSQSAITICNHLMESLLKYSLIYHHSLNNEKPFKSGADLVETMEAYTEEGIKQYGSLTLSRTIMAAHSNGLISEEEKNMLNKFRDEFRNAYSHADKEKTFGDTSVSVQSTKINSKGIKPGIPVQAVIAKNPIVHSNAQVEKAKQDAPVYFSYLDKLVRLMKGRVFPNG